jgi:hypothetical protein
MITLFKTIYDKKPHYSTVEKVLDSIKNGPKQLDLIDQIRRSTDKEERDLLKKQLAVICFGGKFTERRIENLLEYSRLVVLDFDGLVNPKLKRQELMTLPFIYAVFVSPSGDGLKALVRVASDNHTGHWTALAKEIKGVDPSGKDVCRACFISYDPTLYLNPKSDLYTKVIETAYTNEQKLEKLKKWLENKGEKFVSGNRNNFLAKLAGAMNRFGLTSEFALATFERDYVQGTDFSLNEAKQVVNSIYKRYAEFHGTASFDESFGEARVNDVLSSELVTNDVIYLNDVATDLIKDYEVGTAVATTTYFPSIDTIFRPLRGDLNVLGGIGNHGKSAIGKQIDLVASVKEGRRHAWFGPEEHPPLFWYRELIRSYIGKPLEKSEPNRMSLIEYKRGMEFVREHFLYVYPQSLPTPKYILERFAEVIIKDGVTSVTVDPWNQLLHVMQKRDDIYLAETLTDFERFAQQQNIFLRIITHPNRTVKKEDGNYTCPDIYDLNGGPVWNARATNICMYHRPFWGTDKSDPAAEFHSKKIKRQMISGLPGVAMLDYDRRTGRFYDQGFSPLDN